MTPQTITIELLAKCSNILDTWQSWLFSDKASGLASTQENSCGDSLVTCYLLHHSAILTTETTV